MQKTLSPLLRLYLIALLIVLPMDWFEWTGRFLREGGARPAIPLMTLATVFLLVFRSTVISKTLQPEVRRQLTLFAVIVTCGSIAFLANLIFSWSYFGGGKNPVFQFVSQTMLFIVAPVLLIGHVTLFKSAEVREAIMRYLPWAAGLHLLFLCLDASGVLQPASLPLVLFHNVPDYVETIDFRVSGLFSEPSYFGNMSALYGVPLIVLKLNNSKFNVINILLGVSLIVASFLIDVRTVIPTMLLAILAFSWQKRYLTFTPSKLLAAVLIIAATIGASMLLPSIDVEQDGSSAFRLGSAVTAWNVSRAGYGISGIGFGQFHFMYKLQYLPHFLMDNEEAALQLSVGAETRTSTFNLFARLLVETGVIGLSLFMYLIWRYARICRSFESPSMALGATMMGASLGFLTTQDPYCFPPLIFAMALILGTYLEKRNQQLLLSEQTT